MDGLERNGHAGHDRSARAIIPRAASFPAPTRNFPRERPGRIASTRSGQLSWMLADLFAFFLCSASAYVKRLQRRGIGRLTTMGLLFAKGCNTRCPGPAKCRHGHLEGRPIHSGQPVEARPGPQSAERRLPGDLFGQNDSNVTGPPQRSVEIPHIFADHHTATLGVGDDGDFRSRWCVRGDRLKRFDGYQRCSGRVGERFGKRHTNPQPGETAWTDTHGDCIDRRRFRSMPAKKIDDLRHKRLRMPATEFRQEPLLNASPAAPQRDRTDRAGRFDAENDHAGLACGRARLAAVPAPSTSVRTSSSGDTASPDGVASRSNWESSRISCKNRDGIDGRSLPHFFRAAARVSVRWSRARVTPT